MGNNFILLNCHTDIGFIDLLIRNIPWISRTFDTVFVESMRNVESISDYIADSVYEKLESLCTRAQPITTVWKVYEAMVKKYEQAYMPLLFKGYELTEKETLSLYSLFNMKYVYFFKKLMEHNRNIRFIGIEPNAPTRFDDPERDRSMARILHEESRVTHALAIIGSNHGMPLLSQLCFSGKGGFHFVHLTVNQTLSLNDYPFLSHVQNARQQDRGYAVYPGYGCSLQIEHLVNVSQTEQDSRFRSLYKPTKGLVPAPPDMQVDPRTGNTVMRNLV